MNLLWKALLLVRATGLKTIWKVLRYTWYKRHLDKSYNQSHKINYRGPGNLRSVTPNEHGFSAEFEYASLIILFLDDDLVKIAWSQEDQLSAQILESKDCAPGPIHVEWHNDGWRASSSEIKIHLFREGSIAFYNSSGNQIRYSLAPEFQLQQIKSMQSSRMDGWKDTAQAQPGEHYYGLGLHTGGLELSGKSFLIWNSDPGGSYGPGVDPIYMPWPVYLSLNKDGGYLIFYPNTFRAHASFNSDSDQSSHQSQSSFTFEGGPNIYYLIPGFPAQVIKRFTELTGRPGLPPYWSLGYHHSRWGYKNEEEIRDVIDGYLSADLPINSIHLDIDYQQGYRVFTIDPLRFPNLKHLTEDLANKNIHIVTILDPGLKQDPDYVQYKHALENDLLVSMRGSKSLRGVVWGGTTAFPDFSSTKTRKWWGEQYRILLDQGVSGFWHDMNEPSSFSLDTDKSLPLAALHQFDSFDAEHHQVHNIYGYLMNRAGYEGIKSYRPDSRPWIMSRSGWVGNQRYAWNWTADIASTWEGLRLTIAQIINLGLSGQPYSGSDIGGFSGNPDAELYTRWFQAATFMPFFRTHSSLLSKSREPWVFGQDIQRILQRFLKLRQSLLPYLYTLAWQASQSGWPLVRPVFWGDPIDSGLLSDSNTFLLGDCLLVAPILEPGIREQEIYLPPGGWYSFWEQKLWQGSDKITLPVHLETMPVLVRQGSVIPLQDENQLTIHVYSYPKIDKEESSELQYTGELYRDAGDGFGASRLDRFIISETSNMIEIICQSRGDYIPQLEIQGLQIHGNKPIRAWVDGREILNINDRIPTGEFHCCRVEI